MEINPKEYRVKSGECWVVDFSDFDDKNTFIHFDEDESQATGFIGTMDFIKNIVNKFNDKLGAHLYIVDEAGNRITPENKNDGRIYYWYVNGLWVSKFNDGSVETVSLIKDALAFDSFEDVEKAKMAAAEWGYSVKDSITFHEENKHNKNSHILIPSRKKEYKDGDAKEKDERFYIGIGGLWLASLTTKKLEVETTMNKQKAFTFNTLEKAKQFVKDASDFGYCVDSWAIYSNTSEDRVYEFNLEKSIPDFDLIAIDKALVELRRYSDALKAIQKENVDLEKTEKKDGNHYVSFLTGNGYDVNYETAHKIGETIANDLIKKVESAKRHLVELTSLRLK